MESQSANDSIQEAIQESCQQKNKITNYFHSMSNQPNFNQSAKKTKNDIIFDQ